MLAIVVVVFAGLLSKVIEGRRCSGVRKRSNAKKEEKEAIGSTKGEVREKRY